MNYANSFIIFGIFVANHRTAIWAAVINQNQLKVREGLRKNAVYAPAEIRLDLIYGNNNARLIHTMLLLRFLSPPEISPFS